MNTVGYVFGHFWKFEFLIDFFWSFSSRDPPVCTTLFFSKKLPQNKFRTCLDAIRHRLGHFRSIEIFHIFHLSSLEPPGCTEQQFFRKNFLETCSKHVWLLLGTFLGILKNWKFFQLLEVFPSFGSPGCTGQSFFRENYLKTSSKLVWTLLGTFLDTSEISKLRFCFPFVPIFDPAWHDDFKKSHGNMFEHCWVRFWTFLKNWIIFDFSWILSSLDPPVCTTLFFSKKLPQNKFRTCLDAIRHRFGHFRSIENFHIFHLSSLEPPGCTEQQFFRKNFLETCSKHVWLLLGTFLGILKNWKFFQLLEDFPSFGSPGCTGQSFFRENYLKTSSKLVWTLLGTFLDTSEISKLQFCFHFVPIFDPAGHDDFKKSPSNMFEHCWVRFWTFLKNWIIFDFS